MTSRYGLALFPSFATGNVSTFGEHDPESNFVPHFIIKSKPRPPYNNLIDRCKLVEQLINYLMKCNNFSEMMHIRSKRYQYNKIRTGTIIILTKNKVVVAKTDPAYKFIN